MVHFEDIEDACASERRRLYVPTSDLQSVIKYGL